MQSDNYWEEMKHLLEIQKMYNQNMESTSLAIKRSWSPL